MPVNVEIFIANGAGAVNGTGTDDLTLVKGRHQLGFGGSFAFWHSYQTSHARSGGNWTINGQTTGSGLADLLIGASMTSLPLDPLPNILLYKKTISGDVQDNAVMGPFTRINYWTFKG